MAPKRSAEVLSPVPKREQAGMYLLYKLHSGVTYGAVGLEFNVSESTVYIK